MMISQKNLLTVTEKLSSIYYVLHARIAQLAVHLICNQGVGSSSLSAGTIYPVTLYCLKWVRWIPKSIRHIRFMPLVINFEYMEENRREGLQPFQMEKCVDSVTTQSVGSCGVSGTDTVSSRVGILVVS